MLNQLSSCTVHAAVSKVQHTAQLHSCREPSTLAAGAPMSPPLIARATSVALLQQAATIPVATVKSIPSIT